MFLWALFVIASVALPPPAGKICPKRGLLRNAVDNTRRLLGIDAWIPRLMGTDPLRVPLIARQTQTAPDPMAFYDTVSVALHAIAGMRLPSKSPYAEALDACPHLKWGPAPPDELSVDCRLANAMLSSAINDSPRVLVYTIVAVFVVGVLMLAAVVYVLVHALYSSNSGYRAA